MSSTPNADTVPLRGPLVEAIEQLADDVAVERYGDPHVGFVVLLSPDGPPRLAVVSDLGVATPFENVKVGKTMEQDKGRSKGRFFTVQDLEEAAHGLMDALHGAGERRWRPDPEKPLSADVEAMWNRRRDAAIDRQIKATERAIRYAAECPYCHGRYTTKGLTTHIARSVYCSRRAAEAAAVQGSPIERSVDPA